MSIRSKLQRILTHIRRSEAECRRSANSVTLLAVSKTHFAEKIREAYDAGQHCFGENYLQEALEKQKQLAALNIEWHFIGHIQSNKTKQIAEHFSWVHSVDRFSIAKKLNHYRPANLPPLQICIEVNIDNEKTKSGVAPADIISLALQIQKLKNIKLRGLMVIPAINNADAFARTAELQQQLIKAGFAVDVLSMGMTADYELAIVNGATIVRIGSAIFGERVHEQ